MLLLSPAFNLIGHSVDNPTPPNLKMFAESPLIVSFNSWVYTTLLTARFGSAELANFVTH